jgi:ABC-type uncharacterized transport system involved in gliding motility auxiliary subunit
MSQKSKVFNTSFYTAASLVVVLLILVCVNLIGSRMGLRWDITSAKVYSLSGETLDILAGLDRDITIKIFYSSGQVNTPVSIRTHAGRVQDFLDEYAHYSKGRIHIERFDPKMDSVEEEWAQNYGIQRLPLPTGESLYFGLVALSAGLDEVIAFLDPTRERQLEYDLTRLITAVQTPGTARIGVISGLPVFGQAAMPFAMQQSAPQPPWLFIEELRKSYTVVEIRPTAELLPEELDLLMVVHPLNLNDQLLYAMDQYLMRGGNMLLYVDPFAVSDPVSGRGSAGTLQRFFKAWGVNLDENLILMDLDFPTPLRGHDQQVEHNPVWLSLTPAAINAEHILTAQLESLLLPVAGSLAMAPQSDLEVEPLLQSSAHSAMIPNFRVRTGVEQLRKDFVSSDEAHDLALQLNGHFESAFADGAPRQTMEESDDASAQGPLAQPRTTGEHLSKGVTPATVIVLADADMLFDAFSVERQAYMGFEIARMFNDNLNFLLNACEMLTGSEALIRMRSRHSLERPFTRVKELELAAQARWLEQEQALLRRIEETNQSLQQLEQRKDATQRLLISAEQETEMQRFREERARINQELTIVRRNLRAEIEALENRLKFLNIFLVPMLVSGLGIGYALFRRRRRMRN